MTRQELYDLVKASTCPICGRWIAVHSDEQTISCRQRLLTRRDE